MLYGITFRKCMGVCQEFITLLHLGVGSLCACEGLDTASVFTVEVAHAEMNYIFIINSTCSLIMNFLKINVLHNHKKFSV